MDFMLKIVPRSFCLGGWIDKLYGLSAAGIPGDGRCLFRSIAHGACLRDGRPPPSSWYSLSISQVADEFIRRRAESEWFVEGDFDSYVRRMRHPLTWGGEPELLMSSHVLQMPISVYMRDSSGNLNIIAEYGQEYGKENPIRVLYHGYGHYDALVSHSGGQHFRW
ncbi:Ovarian tumor [Macleaya cordata]|uniref:Ubiquitin thioesterase OTU n=1 Tax=Macleaya cordata TaxID=56857 RepID=A0A200QG92_MACCD|nr:Ovarian tumor [Macleaya cordata]